MAPSRMKPLKHRHRRFVQEFLKDGNASAAYLRAGYKSRSPHVHGARLVASGRIKAEIERIARQRLEKADITGEEVLRITSQMARADARDLVTWDGNGGVRLTASHEISDETAMAISEVTIDPDGRVRVKLADRAPALNLLAKVLGMVNRKLEITGKVTLEQLIDESMKKGGNTDDGNS